MKVKEGDEEIDEEVKIDTEKQTETFHIPKTKSSSAGEVDEIFDFKRVSEFKSRKMIINFPQLSCFQNVRVLMENLIWLIKIFSDFCQYSQILWLYSAWPKNGEAFFI